MYYIIDTHCDTLSLLDKNDFLCGSGNMNLSLPRLIRGNVRLQCFAVCVHPWEHASCYAAGKNMIKQFHSLVDSTMTLLQIKSFCDIEEALRSGRIGAMLTLEGADILENDEERINEFYQDGVRIFTFTWNNSGFLGGGIGDNSYGLTQAGFRMLKKCEELGILVDVSHLSEQSFFDIADNSSKPFIASHSNARGVCANKRNLSDEQLYAIARAGGCAGINLYPPFLSDSGKAGIVDVLRHIEYISSLIGTSHISIGTDFDGIDNNLTKNLEHPGKLFIIAQALARLNYSQSDIEAILHGNMERVFKEVLL